MKKHMLAAMTVAITITGCGALLAITITGCGALGNQNPGTVATREYEPGEFKTKTSKTCVQYKSTTCKRYTTTSRQVWESEEFEIVLTDGREFDLRDRAAFDTCTEGRTFDPKKGQC
jgi:hypothetical protein